MSPATELAVDAPGSSGVAMLRRLAGSHRRWLALGALGAVGVVACRLAIPWPLRWVLELALDPGAEVPLARHGSAVPIALAYLGLALGLGLSDLLQRTNLGRFTSDLVDDVRAAAVRGARRSGMRARVGEVTARVVGDAARLRSDLNGILVHASTNGLLYACVCGVMLWVSWVFGLLFLVSGAITLALGIATSRYVAQAASRKRAREGRLAAGLEAELAGLEGPFSDLVDLSGGRARREMRSAQAVGRSLLLAHLVLGGTVAFGLWHGTRAIQAGQLSPGDLFVFAAYALTVHKRMVQVGRQTARTGKVVACANRLAELVGPATPAGAPAPDAAVAGRPRGLGLERAALEPRARPPLRSRLRRMDLDLPAGSRTLVLGGVGSGKSSLLRLLAGQEAEFRGTLRWGEQCITGGNPPPQGVVGFLPERVVFPARELWQLVGIRSASGPDASEARLLQRIGALAVARGVSKDWSTRISSVDVSDRQAHVMALARLLLTGQEPIWILDGVVDELSPRKAYARLDAILERAAGRTLVLSALRGQERDRFDRLIVLRRGRVLHDGPPTDWRGRVRAA